MASDTGEGAGNEGAVEKQKWADSKVYTRKSFKGLKNNNGTQPSQTQTPASEDGNSSQPQQVLSCINAASDDSSTRNRPQVLTAGPDDGLGRNGEEKLWFPRQENQVTLSLCLESKQEMKELRRKLRSELDLVRSLVRKIEAKDVRTNGGGAKRVHSDEASVGLGPRREIRPLHQLSISALENSQGASDSVEKEKRTPKANQFYRNSEFLLAKDKFPSADSNKKSKSSSKKGGSEAGHGFGLGKFSSQVFKSCSNLLERLMKHKYGWVFNEPVDPEALGLHDYFAIVKHPMDLGTVKSRLSKNWYKSPREFAEDVRLTFHNAMIYNPKGQDVHVIAEQQSNVFEEKWAAIEAAYMRELRIAVDYEVGLPTPTSKKPRPLSLPMPEMRRIFQRSESMSSPLDPKSRPLNSSHSGRTLTPKKPKARDPNKREMAYEEKQKLSMNLQSLPSEKLDSVVEIIKKRNTSLSQNNDEIEVDIDSVDTETLWELDRFVTNYKKSLSKNRRKAELANQGKADTGQNVLEKNSAPVAAEAPKQADTGEENIPSLSPAQVELQRKNASKSRNPSSSSDSGSSSSDSDSDSSSGNGSDAAHSPKGIQIP